MLELECTGFVGRPGTRQLVCVGQAYVGSFVVGKVEVVTPEWILDPIWHSNERRPRDVTAHHPIHFRNDDRRIDESLNADYLSLYVGKRESEPGDGDQTTVCRQIDPDQCG